MTDSQTGYGERRRIDDQAAAWAAKRLSGAFPKNEETSLRIWLDADPRHSIALAEYMTIAEECALAGAATGKQVPANDEPAINKPTRWRWLQVGGPALAASLFAAFFFLANIQNAPPHIDRYATARGETLEMSLSDGSMVTLNTDTILTYTVEDGERRAHIERGEVFFKVARDESRPFIVDAGDARARVLGTSFTVHKNPDKSVVSVLSGVVAVSPVKEKLVSEPLRLEAGQTASVTSAGALSHIDEFDTSTIATWRHGYLYFDETPLVDVVADLNRYFTTQIELGDAALGHAPLSGRIELDDQDVAIRAISIALSLQAHRNDTGDIILRADG